MIDVWLDNSCKYCAIRHCEPSLESLSMHVRRNQGLFRCYTSPLAVRRYIIDRFWSQNLHCSRKTLIIKLKQYFKNSEKVSLGDVLAIWCGGFTIATGCPNRQYVQEKRIMISFNKVNTTRVSSLVSDERIKMFLSLQLVISLVRL